MLAANFPGDYYSQDFAKSGDFVGFFNHLAQRENAERRSQINEQSFLEDMFRRREQHPLDMEAKRLGLDLNRARLENEGLEKIYMTKRTDALGRKPEISPEEQAAKLAEYKARLSAAQAKEAEAELQRRLLDPTIQGEERKKLEWARDQLRPFAQQAQKTADRLTVEQFKVDNRPPPRPVAPRGAPRAASTQPKPFKDDLAAAQHWQLQADTATDPQQKAQFTALAEAARERHRQLIQDRENAKKAGTIDLGATGVSVRPPITQGQSPAAAKPIEQAKTLYAINPQTKQRIMSTDGGKTWSPAK